MNTKSKAINININQMFMLSAASGFLVAFLIKFLFPAGEKSFYPTLVVLSVILIFFHFLCYQSLTQDKYKDLGNGQRLSQGSVVDAVYYLGFSFTLIILITTFINVGSSNIQAPVKFDSNLNALYDILNRFCFGLFTTGYGLIARIQLSNIVEIEEADPEGLQERLNMKTIGLINVLDGGINSMDSLIQQSHRTILDSLNTSNKSIQESTSLLSSDTTEVSKKIRSLSKKIEEQVPFFEFKESTDGVKDHLSKTIESINDVNLSILGINDSFVQANKTSNEVIDSMNKSIQNINSQYSEVISKINEFGSELSQLNSQVGINCNNLISYSTALSSSEEPARNFSESISNLNRSIESLASKTNSLIQSVENNVNGFSELTSQFSKTKSASNDATTLIAVESSQLFKELKESNISIANQLGDLSQSFGSLKQALQSLTFKANSTLN